jgi:hypothetical protein
VDKPQTTCDCIVSRLCPISPKHQRQLAFISEFNVQMLFLPGLKNVVADFLFRPPPSPEPSGTVAATTVADPVDFEAKAAEQNSCTETQCLLGGSSLKIAFWLDTWLAMFQLEFSSPWSQ